ncbi:MAG: inorganic phosphate transporter [Bacteroidales bacterium]|nr:inorganic phosphate transporter [Bacteroidales bacterium]
METFYLILVIVLFALAISDLVVGVSNDAVNFLNSAIGAKAAPFKVIMLIAALGVLVGATFSSGLMEVARKGIFHPGEFYFSEIMIIFLAVMITDVILLDAFNTFGLPTSTTVSIVFELLGGAVAISMIKIYAASETLAELGRYINSEKALAIITGILLSVIIAFTIGAFVQYIARLAFTFNYKKNMKYYGALWGGIAITVIIYFMLIKGSKGASFMTDNAKDWIEMNTLAIVVASFIFWTVFLQIISLIYKKFDILKVIVLVGTFALAMAFAGNDLVNFIGVPLAGYESFLEFQRSGAAADNFLMTALSGQIKTDTYLLLIAGLIMVVTLYKSKKARSVVTTSLDLSRQGEGSERFSSTLFSRVLVRQTRTVAKGINYVIPNGIKEKMDKRFDLEKVKESNIKQQKKDAISFDMMRASVNLVVASILIAFGTSLKLPLSTTYVTFMVAMGTSLADGAWGRESAVYRVTGVISVIGGWFLTALSAFTVAFIIAVVIFYGKMPAVIIMILFAAFVVFRTHAVHKKREARKSERDNSVDAEEKINGDNIVSKYSNTVAEILAEVPSTFFSVIKGLANEDLKKLRKKSRQASELNKKAKYLKDNVHITIDKFEEDSIDTGHFYVQVLDFLREITRSVYFIAKSATTHVDNNHKGLLPDQVEELNQLNMKVSGLYKEILDCIHDQRFTEIDNILKVQAEIIKLIDHVNKMQIKRIKNHEAGTKNSLMYLGILSEMKSILFHTINLLKSQRDFIVEHDYPAGEGE